MHKPFLIAALMGQLGVSACWAQTFSQVGDVPREVAALPEFVRPTTGGVFRIDWTALERELSAPGVFVGEAAPREMQALIALPDPRGGTRLYRIIESSIMEPELAAKFPEFRTYRVQGVEDPIAVGRLDITSHGFRGMIRTSEGTIFLDPFSAQQREYESVYFLHEYTGHGGDWACHVGPEHGAGGPVAEPEPVESPAGTGGLPLRTYRMAMACSGEYGAYQATVQGHTPNVTDALSAIVTVVNRCNVTFEVDIGVRFLLVANNNLLAFFNPATDPYADADPVCTSDPAADCSGSYLNVNTPAINSAIGAANYDVGHVLTRVRGGVAFLRSVCTGNKGGGSSGIPRGGEVEPVSALVPMHELGHQFGANHTFNGVLGRCNANINGTTNWEPGGGSTLMAYPGACPVGGTIGVGDTDNLALFADPYFHTGSLIEMRNFLNSATSNCSQTAPTGNLGAPVITSVTPDRAIPPGTPFELSVSVTDGSPTLSYAWDELDVGAAQRLNGPTSVDNGASALFRSLPPAPTGTRVIPRLADLLAGVNYIGERLPTFTGVNRKFRVTIRDNQGASTTSALVNMNIAASAPFTVTEPVAGQNVRPPSVTVRWTPGATASAPINAATVSIKLSLDGGQTFPITLATGRPNSGLATVALPNVTSSQARVRVSGENNVFFNISGGFPLLPACAADYNGDGSLNPDDLGDYITCYFTTTPPCSRADYNADGESNPDDLGDFITAFFLGCG